MNITTNNTPAPDHGEPVAWMHTLDNTEGIPSNRPMVVFDTSPNHPFGQPGKDYSPEFTVTSVPLYPAATIAAMREAIREARDVFQVIAEYWEAIREARDVFQVIAEYWNRDQNERAMDDACWHTIESAEAAITKLQPFLDQ